MLTIDEALSHVLKHARTLLPTNVALEDALGHVLAEDIPSDIDSPPHDKSIVDGYAIRAADLTADIVELNVIEEVVAGQIPALSVERGQATRIMTGAPIPSGADSVVMVERTVLLPAESPSSTAASVRIEPGPFSAGQNIARRGTSMRVGEIVLKAGNVIRPIEIGVLAEVGRTRVGVVRQPSVAVLATGNELVPAVETPQPAHIRNSNGPMLAALATKAGGKAIDLGIGRDDEIHLRELITKGLDADILVLSGGVSAGVLDLVPQVLKDLGVEQIFHKVSLKPGKPLWFGVRNVDERRTLVFGLPGNPVSSLVCFELFVRPAIAALGSQPSNGLKRFSAALANDFVHRGDRPTYHPARMVDGAIQPLPWQGSGDLRTLAEATVLAHFPPGDRSYRAGESIEVLVLAE